MKIINSIYLILILVFPSIMIGGNISRIIDGDTFEMDDGEKVRMIGINAPEISDIYGKEAAIHLEKLLINKTLILVRDELSKNRDRYGRLLRYVIVNSIDINEKMLFDGYASAYLKYKFMKKELYKNAQLFAMEKGNGMYGGREIENIKLKSLDQEKAEELGTPKKSNKLKVLGVGIIILLGVGLITMIRK